MKVDGFGSCLLQQFIDTSPLTLSLPQLLWHDYSAQIPVLRKISWRREWPPTPVFLPGDFHGQRSLVGYSLWGRRASDTTEWLTRLFSLHVVECFIHAGGSDRKDQRDFRTDGQVSAVSTCLTLSLLSFVLSSVVQSCPTLRPHESQHTWLPCPLPTPRVHSDSRPSSR